MSHDNIKRLLQSTNQNDQNTALDLLQKEDKGYLRQLLKSLSATPISLYLVDRINEMIRVKI
jgi:hypothetical protein